MTTTFRSFNLTSIFSLAIAVLFKSVWFFLPLIAVKEYQLMPVKTYLYISIVLLLVYAIWYQLYVFRFKFDIVSLDEENIRIKKFFGVGKTVILPYTIIDIYPSWEKSRIGSGAKLLLYTKGRRLTELSDFSYSNYTPFIEELGKHSKFKGFVFDKRWQRLQVAIGMPVKIKPITQGNTLTEMNF